MSFSLKLNRRGKKDANLEMSEGDEGVLLINNGGSKVTEVPKAQCSAGSAYQEALVRAATLTQDGWICIMHNPPDGTDNKNILMSMRWQCAKEDLEEQTQAAMQAIAKWNAELPDDDSMKSDGTRVVIRGPMDQGLMAQSEFSFKDSMWAGMLYAPKQAIAAAFLKKAAPKAITLTMADKPFDLSDPTAISALLAATESIGAEAYSIAGKLGLIFDVRQHIKTSPDSEAWF